MLSPEQDCLLQLARMVWQRRGAAKQAGLPLNEETITETFLLDLKTRYPGRVEIVPFSKAKEAQLGADWAWAFISADKHWSITMLVQAKRLDDRERNYKGINRNIGTRSPPVRQIDQLIQTGARYGIPPIYAFYNHLGTASRVPMRCRSINPASIEQLEGWGISIASAYMTKARLPSESFDTHSMHSIPLHCLLCTWGSGDPGPTGSPGPVGHALNRLGPPPPSGSEGIGPGPDRFAPREGLHPIIRATLNVAEIENAEEREGMAERLAEEFPGVAGAVILRDGREPKD
jgi:hypothetical protein